MIDFPNSPTVGQIFTAGGVSWRWDGTKWAVVGSTAALFTIGDTPPSSPVVGQGWYDSVGGQLYIWYDDGNSQQWVTANNIVSPVYQVGPGITINTGTTPNTLSVTPGHIPGTSTGDAAATGEVGQYLSTVIPVASAVALTNNGWTAIISGFTIPAGDWDIWGEGHFNMTTGPGATSQYACIGPGTGGPQSDCTEAASVAAIIMGGDWSVNNKLAVAPLRALLTTATNYAMWLYRGNTGAAVFTGYGTIRARRRR